MKTVYKSSSQADVDFVNEFLKSNGLNTSVKYQGAGSYLNITTGYPCSEIQLLVSDDEVEKACNLLKEIEPEKDAGTKEVIKKNTSVRVFAWIALAVLVFAILFSTFQSIMDYIQ